VNSTTTIGEVARLGGVTIRTLRHYDDIGLLVPSERRPNGYRGYSNIDIARLQRILTYRELGLGLDVIARILDEPTGTVEALVGARRRIRRRMAQLEMVAAGLDAAIDAEQGGIEMTPEERLSAFGDFDPDEYADEAAERWGSTGAYAEAAERTGRYSAEDWRRQRREADEIDQQFLSLIDAGIAASSAEAAAVVDAHRAHMTKWFYECTPEIHAGLGVMYAADPRFTKNIDAAGEGLAAYLSAAISSRYGSEL